MTIKLKIAAFFVFAIVALPSSPSADEDILTSTIGRLIIENTIGSPVDPHTESRIRRFADNPEVVIDHNTQGHIIAEKIRNAESRRRLEQLLDEQINRDR